MHQQSTLVCKKQKTKNKKKKEIEKKKKIDKNILGHQLSFLWRDLRLKYKTNTFKIIEFAVWFSC